MERDLAKLISDYLRTGNNYEQFINDAIEIILYYNELENYIIKVKKLNSCFALGSYNKCFKTIKINYELIKKEIEYDLKEYQNSTYSSAYKYILFVQILLHEIEHVKQYKKISENNTLEDLILKRDIDFNRSIIEATRLGKLSFPEAVLKIISYQIKYLIYYNYSPSERLANINASITSSKIAAEINDEYSLLMTLHQYYNSLLRGYNIENINHKPVIPTKHYFDSLGCDFIWYEIAECIKNVPFIDRIKLGLECDLIELHEINEKNKMLSIKLRNFDYS